MIQWQLQQTFASVPQMACELIRSVVSELETRGWTESDMFAIHMALEESIMNAIKHGNKCDPAKQVTVRFQLFEDRFEVVIRDQGAGFRLEDVPDPTLEENLENTSGRGVMLIQQFMDQVEYQDGGCQVAMLKRRSQPE